MKSVPVRDQKRTKPSSGNQGDERANCEKADNHEFTGRLVPARPWQAPPPASPSGQRPAGPSHR